MKENKPAIVKSISMPGSPVILPLPDYRVL